MKNKIKLNRTLLIVFFIAFLMVLIFGVMQSYFLTKTKDALVDYINCGSDLDKCSSLCLNNRGINDCYPLCITSHQSCVAGVLDTLPMKEEN